MHTVLCKTKVTFRREAMLLHSSVKYSISTVLSQLISLEGMLWGIT
jgi:hypothetical protein